MLLNIVIFCVLVQYHYQLLRIAKQILLSFVLEYMDSERIISVFEERMRLQRYAPSTIKSYKEYVTIFLKEMQGYKNSLLSLSQV